MTFLEFALLEPGAVVHHAGRRVVYVGDVRFHPMAQRIAAVFGASVHPSPRKSILSCLREAHAQVLVPNRPPLPEEIATLMRPLAPGAPPPTLPDDLFSRAETDAEILAAESRGDPYGYYRAVIQVPGTPGPEPVPVSPADLSLNPTWETTDA